VKYLIAIYFAVFAVYLNGCNAAKTDTSTNGDDPDKTIQGESTVEVYKYEGSVQCYDGGIDLDTMELELTDNGITVLSSYRDGDGYYHIASCGAGTGKINIYEIHSDDLDAALSLGFNTIDNL